MYKRSDGSTESVRLIDSHFLFLSVQTKAHTSAVVVFSRNVIILYEHEKSDNDFKMKVLFFFTL